MSQLFFKRCCPLSRRYVMKCWMWYKIRKSSVGWVLVRFASFVPFLHDTAPGRSIWNVFLPRRNQSGRQSKPRCILEIHRQLWATCTSHVVVYSMALLAPVDGLMLQHAATEGIPYKVRSHTEWFNFRQSFFTRRKRLAAEAQYGSLANLVEHGSSKGWKSMLDELHAYMDR